MTTGAPEDPPVPADPADAIWIVPLRVDPSVLRPLDETVLPAATPQLTYRGGHLLTSVKVFTVFWGGAWEQQPVRDTVGQINQFFETILSSELMDQLTEYNVPGQQIGHGTWIGSATVATPAPSAAVSDTQIQSFLRQQITAGTLPAADLQTLYFVYTPPGVVVVQGGAVVPGILRLSRQRQRTAVLRGDAVPGVLGMHGDDGRLRRRDDDVLARALRGITDAVPGAGWYDDVNGEIGDICAWTTKTVAGYTVQQEWSDAATSCR
jgi:hypothetical protein